MSKVLVKSVITIVFLVMLMAVPVYGASVNKSIKVAAGSESDGESSVNGSITVGEGAVVSGPSTVQFAWVKTRKLNRLRRSTAA